MIGKAMVLITLYQGPDENHVAYFDIIFSIPCNKLILHEYVQNISIHFAEFVENETRNNWLVPGYHLYPGLISFFISFIHNVWWHIFDYHFFQNRFFTTKK